jgi:hypothetical protein
MKIARVGSPEFSLTFSRDDGWALVMALKDAYTKYPEAADREQWKQWAEDLDKELRRGI